MTWRFACPHPFPSKAIGYLEETITDEDPSPVRCQFLFFSLPGRN